MEEQLNIPMQSATIGKLVDALSKFQGSLKQPKLNKNVTVTMGNGKGKYNFKYADLGACMSAAVPELQKNGLAVTQTIHGNYLVTTLAHSSGEYINSMLPLNQGTLFSTAFQQIGSMITYLKRYAYCAILGIVADDDDDANAACANGVEYHQQVQQTAQPQPAQQQAPAVTGATIKKAIEEANKKANIEDLKAFWNQVFTKYPSMQSNEQFNGALFQKASAIAIEELQKVSNQDEELLFIDRWTDMYGERILAENTPLGNAIIEKRKTYQA